MLVKSINPATLKVNKTFRTLPKNAALEACKKAQDAFQNWRALDVSERCAQMKKLAAVLREKKDEYARLVTVEMGKPIKQATSEVEKCAWAAEVYAENGAKWLTDEDVKADGKKHAVTFAPLGVVLSIMPWNFPFWQALRFAIPALTAGNAGVLRHSNTVPLCSLAIQDAFEEAGFPKNVFQSIITDYETVDKLIASPHVNGVSLTGSVGAGQKIAEAAGRNLKKFVLELGGSDPFIVLEDAPLARTCKGAVDGRIVNTGQSCIAAKRFIVVRAVAPGFIAGVVELSESLKIGDPLDERTDLGPLANEEQIVKLEGQVRDAVRKGARVLCGGKRYDGSKIGRAFRRGYFFEPTVLTHVKKNMRVLNDEVFGPVMPVIVVKDEEEAIRVANDSEFGLGASVWTSDAQRGERVARRLEAGVVFVNNIVKSDPRMPFGGIKRSGVGRELSQYGLKEFVNIKGVNVYDA